MRSMKAMVCAVLLFTAVLTLNALVPQQAPAPATPPPAPGQGAAPPGTPTPAAAPPQGRGGRGAAAMLYTEQCAGCHGADLNGGRAPSLFDQAWGIPNTDEAIVRKVEEGSPAAGMPPFKGLLSDAQIWQLVAYIRTQAATLKGRPTYVPDPANQLVKSEKQTFTIEVVAKDIETPWALAFLPDRRLLVTERPGRLRIVDTSGRLSPPVEGLPTVWEWQDGGLFDVEVHPQYARNGWIYLAYAEPGPNNTGPTRAAPPPAGTPGGGRGAAPPATDTAMTKIVRGRIDRNNRWVDQQVIFQGAPELYTNSRIHFGARFIFDRQGHLFYSIGDRGSIPDAQDLSKPAGKIHRVNDDGSVPKDNPFVTRPGALPTIWSYGHRNPQGLAWHPQTGDLWESEHGPTGGDEINVIEKGKNYGWGEITMGVQQGITKRSEPGMEQPLAYYTPSIGPSGITFYAGNRYPAWRNHLFVSGLVGQQLRRLETRAHTVTHQEVVFGQFGRVHDVIVGPDGYLYTTLQLPGAGVSMSTPGMVVRLIPARP